MNIKIIVYVVNLLLVLIGLSSVNINAIFKKNKIIEARILYFIIVFIMTYLLTNFVYDFINVSKIF